MSIVCGRCRQSDTPYARTPTGQDPRVAGLDALGLRGVTRLAVSPAGDRIAIVAQAK